MSPNAGKVAPAGPVPDGWEVIGEHRLSAAAPSSPRPALEDRRRNFGQRLDALAAAEHEDFPEAADVEWQLFDVAWQLGELIGDGIEFVVLARPPGEADS